MSASRSNADNDPENNTEMRGLLLLNILLHCYEVSVTIALSEDTTIENTSVNRIQECNEITSHLNDSRGEPTSESFDKMLPPNGTVHENGIDETGNTDTAVIQKKYSRLMNPATFLSTYGIKNPIPLLINSLFGQKSKNSQIRSMFLYKQCIISNVVINIPSNSPT